MKTNKSAILTIFFSLTLLCCTNNPLSSNSLSDNTLTNDSLTNTNDMVLSRVFREGVYDCYNYRDDTLLCGLSYVYKETNVYSNGDTVMWLRLLLEDTGRWQDRLFQTFVSLNEKEISDMEVFVDSCLTSQKEDGSYWQMRLNSGAFFYYDSKKKSIVYCSEKSGYLNLQISPERLRDVLDKVSKGR